MSTTEPAQDITGDAETAAEATAPAPEGDHSTQDGTARAPGKFRQRLADAEAERDTLRGKVETMQRAEVERLAAQADLAVPKAIWANGTDLGDLLDPDGRVDPERVTSAVTGAIAALGLATRPRNPLPDMGQGARAQVTPPGKEHPWAEMLKGNGASTF